MPPHPVPFIARSCHRAVLGRGGVLLSPAPPHRTEPPAVPPPPSPTHPQDEDSALQLARVGSVAESLPRLDSSASVSSSSAGLALPAPLRRRSSAPPLCLSRPGARSRTGSRILEVIRPLALSTPHFPVSNPFPSTRILRPRAWQGMAWWTGSQECAADQLTVRAGAARRARRARRRRIITTQTLRTTRWSSCTGTALGPGGVTLFNTTALSHPGRFPKPQDDDRKDGHGGPAHPLSCSACASAAGAATGAAQGPQAVAGGGGGGGVGSEAGSPPPCTPTDYPDDFEDWLDDTAGTPSPRPPRLAPVSESRECAVLGTSL